MAENILALAKRIVRLEQQGEQLAREKEQAIAEYRKLLASIGRDQPKDLDGEFQAKKEKSLRERVLTYLRQNAGVSLALYEIERALNLENEHRRLIWTLANMKRDGIVRHDGRGLWSVGKEDDEEAYKPPQGDEDIPF